MKTKADPRFDAYLAKSAKFAQPILWHLRALVHTGCPEAEETIKWGHPGFVYRGKLFCGLAAFKAHSTFGFWHQGMEKIIAQNLGQTDQAMGLLGRITRLANLPDDRTMIRYIQTAAKLIDSDAPARPPPKPKKPLPVPADLTAALRKNQAAAATFEKFSPSHRREYVEWITEAKRDETRQKRLTTTLEWLAEGKARNWKYMNC
ncbi:MAG: hypothetical protein EXS32_11045 [Opitutus sp.]|nr:hypothetical protein [Opitutus sp.]